MFSYFKSLLAVSLVVAAVLAAGLWAHSRLAALGEANRARENLRLQTAGSQAYPEMIAAFEKKLKVLQRDSQLETRKFLKLDSDSTRLINMVVKAASGAGLEMINASKLERKAEVVSVGNENRQFGVIAHEITLKGSYAGLVKFMQSLQGWDLRSRLESFEITPVKESAGGEIEMALILSVYSLETNQPAEMKKPAGQP